MGVRARTKHGGGSASADYDLRNHGGGLMRSLLQSRGLHAGHEKNHLEMEARSHRCRANVPRGTRVDPI